MSKLQYGICGNISTNTKPADNPFTSLREERVQEMLLMINRNPCGRAELLAWFPDLTDHIDRMLHLRMLKEKGRCVHVNFTLFDETDKQLIWEISDVHARALAETLTSWRQELHALLAPLATPWVDVRQLSFLVLGCYLLDWGALSMLNDWEVINSRKQQPGGNVYTLWAEANAAGALRAIYWGGHSMQIGEYLLHTFGDHDAETRRLAMPDLLYRVYNGEMPGKEDFRVLQMWKNAELGHDLATVLAAIGRHGADDQALRQSVMLQDAEKLSNMLRLLDSLGYIRKQKGSYALQVPFFTMDDLDVLERVTRMVIPVLKQWVDTALGQYEQDIAGCCPLRNGVPFTEVFVQCWHYVFGLTNKYLAEQRVICDTYSGESLWKGYLPGLIKGPVLQALLERVNTKSAVRLA